MSTVTNVTFFNDTDPYNLNMKRFSSVFITLFVMSGPGLIANSLTAYCVIPDLMHRKTVMKQLLAALCLTDMCGCISVFFFQLTKALDNVPRSVCACSSFLVVYVPMISGMITTCMALERALALRAPYWYQTHMFGLKMWGPFMSVVLLITVVCLFPQVGLGDVVKTAIEGNVTTLTCGTFLGELATNRKEATFSVTYGVLGLVMVAVNISCNSIAVDILNKMRRRVNPNVGYTNTTDEFEMTKLLLALSGTFLICWLPMNMQLVVVQLGFKKYYIVNVIVLTLVGINFSVDPIIYLVMKRNYRQKTRQLCCYANTDNNDARRSSEVDPAGRIAIITIAADI